MDAIFFATGAEISDFRKLEEAISLYVRQNSLTWQIMTSANPRSIVDGQRIGEAIGGNFTSKSFQAFKHKYTLTEPIDFLRGAICCWCRKNTRLAICAFHSDFIWSHFSMVYNIELKLQPGEAIILKDFNRPKEWLKQWMIFNKLETEKR